jgi:hypothetical protein
MWLTAAIFFSLGAIAAPYGPWLSSNQSSNPIFDWAIYLATVGIPIAIAVAIARYSLKKHED